MKMRLMRAKLLLIIILVSAVSLVIATHTNTIYPLDTSANPGIVNVSVAISLDNDVPVAGFQFQLNHPNILIYKGIQTTSRLTNATIESNNISSASVRIAVLKQNNISAGNGTMLNIIFDVNETAASGSYSLNLSDLMLSNISALSVPSSPLQGILTITSDADSDGIVDSLDFCPAIAGCSAFSGCSYGISEWLPPITNTTEFQLEVDATLPYK